MSKKAPRFGPLVVTRAGKPTLGERGRAILDEFLAKYDPPAKILIDKYPTTYGYLRDFGVSQDDIVQMCYVGAMRAIWLFDPDQIAPRTNRPISFSTYALWWMRAECSKALRALSAPHRAGVTVRLIHNRFAGTDTPDDDPEDNSVEERVELDDIADAKERIHRAMFTVLSEKERSIIRARYAIGWDEPASLEECRVLCGLSCTKESVRLAQRAAEGKLLKAMGGAKS